MRRVNTSVGTTKEMKIILTELKISQITEFIYRYRKKNWKEHVDRMSCDRIPKMILKYQPKGKRNLRRPLKTWKDSVL
jgi:hypothetical protein